MANDMSPISVGAEFDLPTFFAGRTRAWGIFEDRFGNIRRRFSVEMTGLWEGAVFVLEERFRYDTGEDELRTWRIRPGQEGRFTADCDDCVGLLQGRCSADAVKMEYKFRLRIESRSLTVDFDDRIYRMGDDIAINRATMRKWGVKLGEVSLFFERVRTTSPARNAVASVA